MDNKSNKFNPLYLHKTQSSGEEVLTYFDPRLLRSTIESLTMENRFHRLYLHANEKLAGYNFIAFPSSIYTLAYNYDYIYCHKLTVSLAFLCADFHFGDDTDKVINDSYYPLHEMTEDGDTYCRVGMIKDLNRATLPYSLIAWLTTDDYRLHKDPKYKAVWDKIPEDLNYGLILRYPNYVFAYSLFIIDYKTPEYSMRERLLKPVPQKLIEIEEKDAVRVAGHYPKV